MTFVLRCDRLGQPEAIPAQEDARSMLAIRTQRSAIFSIARLRLLRTRRHVSKIAVNSSDRLSKLVMDCRSEADPLARSLRTSRLLDLKSEAHRFRRRNISAVIAADVKRFCHQSKRTRFSAAIIVPLHPIGESPCGF